MHRNAQTRRKHGRVKRHQIGNTHRVRKAADSHSERARTLWRAVKDHLFLETLNTHLQGMYAELGKLYFEHLQKVPRLPLSMRAEAEQLSARISEFRRQRARLELQQGPASDSGPAAGRKGAARRQTNRP